MNQMQSDQFAVADLIHRERAARDDFRWDEMASYYHPESLIDVAWFTGSGADFIAGSKKIAAAAGQANQNIHMLSPSVVTVNKDRAVADTGCMLVAKIEFNGTEIGLNGYVRLMSRAIRKDGQWLIAGLRVIYLWDQLVASNPTRMPQIDDELLKGFRPAYRHLSYVLTQSGLTPRQDLPGGCRPELVAALRDGEMKWLNGQA